MLILLKYEPFLGTLEIAPATFPLIIKTLLSPLLIFITYWHGQLDLLPTVFVADYQTRGRGQHSRFWESKTGGLYYSLLINDPLTVTKDSSFTTLVAQRLGNIIFDITEMTVKVEWPNDLIVQDKKLGGILCERGTYHLSRNFLVIGIGLNLNQLEFSDNLQASAISLRQITGKEYNKTVFIESITKELTSWLCEEFVVRSQ